MSDDTAASAVTIRPLRSGDLEAYKALRDQMLAVAMLHATDGIEMLTLTVTHGNTPAINLYERSGFVHCGSLPRAIRVGDRYHAKEQMFLML